VGAQWRERNKIMTKNKQNQKLSAKGRVERPLQHEVKRNIARIIRFIELEAPKTIIEHDIFNLANKYTGGSFRTVLFAIKSWWQLSKINPHYYLILLEVKKQLRSDEYV